MEYSTKPCKKEWHKSNKRICPILYYLKQMNVLLNQIFSYAVAARLESPPCW